MSHISRCFRSGIIKSVTSGRFQPEGAEITDFYSIILYSEFEVGFREYRKETTRVLLVGQAADWWAALDPKPGMGDELEIQFGTLYFNSDGACVRVFSPDNVRVLSQAAVASSKKKSVEYIDAQEFFQLNANKTI